jgi:hypothetical protein
MEEVIKRYDVKFSEESEISDRVIVDRVPREVVEQALGSMLVQAADRGLRAGARYPNEVLMDIFGEPGIQVSFGSDAPDFFYLVHDSRFDLEGDYGSGNGELFGLFEEEADAIEAAKEQLGLDE